jgi:hypothetical protein
MDGISAAVSPQKTRFSSMPQLDYSRLGFSSSSSSSGSLSSLNSESNILLGPRPVSSSAAAQSGASALYESSNVFKNAPPVWKSGEGLTFDTQVLSHTSYTTTDTPAPLPELLKTFNIMNGNYDTLANNERLRKLAFELRNTLK